MGAGFQKAQKVKVKEKSLVRMTRVVNKKSFYSHCRMDDSSYHHKSLEIHLIVTLEATTTLFPKGHVPVVKTSHLDLKIMTVMYGTREIFRRR
jgi:hypothetical protein